MLRLVLLSVAGALVFVGFGSPFVIPGQIGLLVGFVLVAVGVSSFWVIESKTRKSLEKTRFGIE